MQNILVTGGTGYIGSHTVVELVESGYRPIIIDDLSNSIEKVLDRLHKITGKQILFFKGSFWDPKLLAKVFDAHDISGVVHFAAFKSVGESIQQPLKYYSNNVGGLVVLLEFLKTQNPLNFVFSSSCIVYGETDLLPIAEESNIQTPKSPYGATKQMCEMILSDVTKISKNMRTASLRYFNPIGAHRTALIGELPIGTPDNLVPLLTQTAAGLRPKLTVFGDDYPTPDGSCIRDYIHVVDLAKAHVQTLRYLNNKKAGFYDFFNVGTGKGTSVLELIKTFEETTGQKVNYEIGPRRAGDIVASYAAVEKAQRLLKWRAEKSLADALADAWRWQQSLAPNQS